MCSTAASRVMENKSWIFQSSAHTELQNQRIVVVGRHNKKDWLHSNTQNNLLLQFVDHSMLRKSSLPNKSIKHHTSCEINGESIGERLWRKQDSDGLATASFNGGFCFQAAPYWFPLCVALKDRASNTNISPQSQQAPPGGEGQLVWDLWLSDEGHMQLPCWTSPEFWPLVDINS